MYAPFVCDATIYVNQHTHTPSQWIQYSPECGSQNHSQVFLPLPLLKIREAMLGALPIDVIRAGGLYPSLETCAGHTNAKMQTPMSIHRSGRHRQKRCMQCMLYVGHCPAIPRPAMPSRLEVGPASHLQQSRELSSPRGTDPQLDEQEPDEHDMHDQSRLRPLHMLQLLAVLVQLLAVLCMKWIQRCATRYACIGNGGRHRLELCIHGVPAIYETFRHPPLVLLSTSVVIVFELSIKFLRVQAVLRFRFQDTQLNELEVCPLQKPSIPEEKR